MNFYTKENKKSTKRYSVKLFTQTIPIPAKYSSRIQTHTFGLENLASYQETSFIK